MSRHEELKDFLEGLCDNPEEEAAAIERQAKESEIVRALVKYRNLLDLSQRQLAKCAGLTQSKVQRMEAGTDADLRWGDISAYMKGLGIAASVDCQSTAESSVEFKQRLILTIGGLLEELRRSKPLSSVDG